MNKGMDHKMLQDLEKRYRDALRNLAEMLDLSYGQMAGFCGDVRDGAFGARRLREYFRTPPVSDQLDSIIRISEEYCHLSGG